MGSQTTTIAVDAVGPRTVADFWCRVLGWQVAEEDDEVLSIALDLFLDPEGNEFCPLSRTVQETRADQ